MGGTVSCFEPGNSSVFLNAAVNGDVEELKERLDYSLELVIYKGIGGLRDTAWHLAAAYGHVPILKELYHVLQHHMEAVQPKLTKVLGAKAIQGMSLEDMRRYVLNQKNIKGQTPLMFACFAGSHECVSALMQMGADPWASDLCGERTALHYAALAGHAKCIEAVMTSLPPNARYMRRRDGSEVRLVDLRTACNFSPLHYAAYSRAAGVCQVLLEYEASLVAVTSEGDLDIVECPSHTTPLHIAAMSGNETGCFEILRHYLSRRDTGTVRDPRTCVDRASRRPYQAAVQRGHQGLAELIHPARNLDIMFGSNSVEKLGVPKLSVLAAEVLKQALLSTIDAADSVISTISTHEPEKQISTLSNRVIIGNRAAMDSVLNSIRASNTSVCGASPGGVSPRSNMSRATSIRVQDTPLFAEHPALQNTAQAVHLESDVIHHPGITRPIAWSTCVSQSQCGEVLEQAATDLANPPNATACWVGIPVPNDRTMTVSAPGLLDKLRDLTRVSRKSTGRDKAVRGTSDSGLHASDNGFSRNMTHGNASFSHSAGNPSQVAGGAAGALMACSSRRSVDNPFAAISWGTQALISTLQSESSCVVCLEEIHCLVLVPCIHRLCVPCARRMVMTVKDKPLGCPVCRQNVRTCHAASDVQTMMLFG